MSHWTTILTVIVYFNIYCISNSTIIGLTMQVKRDTLFQYFTTPDKHSILFAVQTRFISNRCVIRIELYGGAYM